MKANAASYLELINSYKGIWLPKYYDFNLHNKEKLAEKLNYMHNNPVRAGLAKYPAEWKWSSARWYEEQKDVGVPIAPF